MINPTPPRSGFPIPNAIYAEVAKFLPMEAGNLNLTSKAINAILKKDQTWIMIANNLHIPLKPDQPVKTQVLEYYYYKETNELLLDFLIGKLPEGVNVELFKNQMQKLIKQDPKQAHQAMKELINQEYSLLDFVQMVQSKLNISSNNQVLLVFYDSLLGECAAIQDIFKEIVLRRMYEYTINGQSHINFLIFDQLIQKGAEDNDTIRDLVSNPYTPIKVIEYFINKGFKISPKAVFQAVANLNKSILELFFNRGYVLTQDEYEDCMDKAKELGNQGVIDLLEAHKPK